MLIMSSRKNFSDPDVLSDSGHFYREIDLSNDSTINEFSDQSSFIQHISGKKVLILVHGYNNEQGDVHDAYAVIENKVQQHMNNEYDFILGYSWPGGDKGLEWWASKKRANSVARRFRFLLQALSQTATSIDIMSHSLGARVVLKALKQVQEVKIVRNYFCTAAAVDNEVLEKNEEFSESIDKAEAIFVFHSNKDGVLSLSYRIAELDRALGLSGPEDKAYIQNKTKNIYVANCKYRVDSHGEYKRSDHIYQYMRGALVKKPTKFKTL